MSNQSARRRNLLFMAGLTAVTCIAVASISLASATTAPQTAATAAMPSVAFIPRPLTNASTAEIGQAAVAYIAAHYPVYSGTPQLVLSRTVVPADIPALGLGTAYSSGTIETPPLALTITKGDFGGGTNEPHRNGTERYRYIGLLWDLWAGVPTDIISSADGGVFRIALNDPSLPVLPTLYVNLSPTPPPTLHYGGIAPTVALPGSPVPPPTPVPSPTPFPPLPTVSLTPQPTVPPTPNPAPTSR